MPMKRRRSTAQNTMEVKVWSKGWRKSVRTGEVIGRGEPKA